MVYSRMIDRENPLVSIIIPVYNGANYLSQAIESALAQTYLNCEVIVVNDGSDDEGATKRTANAYGDRIRYFEKENGGVASALNEGIRRMGGEYFSWLSHDDLYYPDKIEMELRPLLASGDRSRLVQAEYEFYHMPTRTRTSTDFHMYYSSGQITNSFFSVLWLQAHACSALVHRSHFERVGLFDEGIRTVQDVDMWFRLFRDQESLFIPRILHTVREHDQAGSKTISCYHEETGRIYMKLINQLDYEEMARVFGNAPAFLCRMAGFLKSYGRYEELGRVKALLAGAPKPGPGEEESSARQLSEYLLHASGGRRRKLAVFGAGQYGIRIKYELESRMVCPDYFIDNDREKWGKMIDGIPCLGMKEAEAMKDELLVVAAQRILSPALSELRKRAFSYYISKQELEAKVLKALPVMSRKKEWL